MNIQLIPIAEKLEDNVDLLKDPIISQTLAMTIEYYQRIGYQPPWIGYFVYRNGLIVGSGGFKGQPKENKVELAYGCFEPFQRQGIGTAICKLLLYKAIATLPEINVMARTLPDNFYSHRVLEKNGFICLGKVIDPEDGQVLEWMHQV